MNDIKILPEEAMGLGFVPPEQLAPGEDEYRIRDEQLRALGRDPKSYRRLRPFELEILVKNDNTCRDWNQLLVTDPFAPELVKNSAFAGLVRLGRLERAVIEHHDTRAPVGIYRSRLVACDVGDNCAILDCSSIAHYIVGDGSMLVNNDEIEASNHAKFGNGVVMEGEPEEVRIELDLMNEAGGRSVLPFDGMLPADAYLWARRRGDPRLLSAFKAMTESMFDLRRGRYGEIGHHSVLKSNGIMKDVKIGPCAYIKGANKLKNLTVNSSEEARTQIGEGVELVNGIIGYGCRVFYGCKAVRFVMGDNSALKYGARLIHSVLGENSTVSCCEILNNLIFPAHEQHHNTSFLIASLVRGQSNMAAGATIGSNHNSRANDGEIEAGRGFWPGLSTSVKHSSRFASFCLLAKGDYRYELDLRLPFCLVDDDRARERLVLVPAYWWTHNLYALLRNESKFESRDRRRDKALVLEYSPFAPDTAEEIWEAMRLLEDWAGRPLGAAAGAGGTAAAGGAADGAAVGPAPDEILARGVENSGRPVVVVKPARACKAYREMLLWYAAGTVADFAESLAAGLPAGGAGLFEALAERLGGPEAGAAAASGPEAWENLGGQLVPAAKLEALLSRAAAGKIADWKEMHTEYARLAAEYPLDKARHAWATLARLYGGASADRADGASPARRGAATRAEEAPGHRAESLQAADLLKAFEDYARLSSFVEEEVYATRKKDYDNRFRRATFRSDAEYLAVMGRPEDNPFVKRTRRDLAARRARLEELSGRL